MNRYHPVAFVTAVGSRQRPSSSHAARIDANNGSWHTAGMKPLIAILVATSVLVAGCKSTNPHMHGGQLICDPTAGTTRVEKAPVEADYTLFAWTVDPKPNEPMVRPYMSCKLEKGQPIGLKRGPNGELLAVAGTQETALPEGRYCWHLSHGEVTTAKTVARDGFIFTGEVVTISALAAGIAAGLFGWLWLESKIDDDDTSCSKHKR